MKQAPRAWYAHIESYLVKLGFIRSNFDPNLHFKVVQGMSFILVSYVDDLFLTSSEPLMIECKRELAFEFKMKDLGLMHYFLGLEVWQRPDEIFLSQGKYVVKFFNIFGMQVTTHTDGNELQEVMWRSYRTRSGESIRV